MIISCLLNFLTLNEHEEEEDPGPTEEELRRIAEIEAGILALMPQMIN